jgi:predicted peptidase
LSTRISEVEYTWTKGKTLMQVSMGPKESYIQENKQPQSIFKLVYNENKLYNYVLYLPKNYNPKDKTKKWPVVYFFHGIGEKGSDLTKLLAYGLPKYIQDTGSFDMIMIAPQCPEDSHWADTDVEEKKLVVFVDDMLKKYSIDEKRMYLTGLSMGGRCTWKLALALPHKFAAIAPVCGRTNTYDFTQIKDLPIWMFHGALDDTVLFTNVNKIVEELLKNNNSYFKLTVYPYASHDSWTNAYNNEELYKWMLKQSLK